MITLKSLGLLLLTLSFFAFAYQTQIETRASKTAQELSQVFKRYELLTLDPVFSATQVKDSGRLSLSTSIGNLVVRLSPHDMRAPTYRALIDSAAGPSHSFERGVVETFKGRIEGIENSQARFSTYREQLEGMLIINGELYQIEPARNFAAAAGPTDFVFYKHSDVIQKSLGSCGVTAGNKLKTLNSDQASTASLSFSPPRVVELATEADYEYVSGMGGAANANNDILAIMNQVEGVYESQLGITFEIVFQHAWETPDDPYTTTSDSIQIFNEFKDYWNANLSAVPRDVAHMWTGKNMGGVLGRGSQSVACAQPTFAYAISRLDDRVPLKYNTPAHEIGHNLGATHADSVPECTGSIMRPTTTSGLTFCDFSRAEITQYVQQFGNCLTATTYTINGQVTDINGGPIAGVTAKLSGPDVRTATSDNQGRFTFAQLNPGANYTLTVSKTNYAFNPQSVSFQSLDGNKTAQFTVVNSPDGPLLVLEPQTNNAMALDSVTLRRGPFPIFTTHNFSSDGRTRVMLFGVNIFFLSGEDVSVLTAQAEDAAGTKHALQVESVERVPGFEWLSQIIIKLPDELSNPGDAWITVNLRGLNSNNALISIAPR